MTKFIEIDILGDKNDDVRIESSFFFDSGEIRGAAINDDIMFSYTTEEGEAFSAFWDHSLIAQTSILCNWSDLWLPDSGERYVGFYAVDQSQDTTFGWIKMDFRGEIDNCEDTLLILESAYNTIPNKPLLAGEKLISAIQIESIDYKILAYPNPAHDQIHITLEGTESAQFQFSVMDAFGATIHVHKRFVHQQTLDISEWDTGIYYLKIQDAISKRTKFYKFVKI